VNAKALVRFVPDCLVLFKRLIGDARVPRRYKLMLGVLVAYLAMPLDLIPDFIPVIGLLDDAFFVALALRTLVRGADAGLLREHWPGPSETLEPVLRLAGSSRARGRS
jgi:uncharacterized membrane protein YkvA (DUF1232 family)